MGKNYNLIWRYLQTVISWKDVVKVSSILMMFKYRNGVLFGKKVKKKESLVGVFVFCLCRFVNIIKQIHYIVSLVRKLLDTRKTVAFCQVDTCDDQERTGWLVGNSTTRLLERQLTAGKDCWRRAGEAAVFDLRVGWQPIDLLVPLLVKVLQRMIPLNPYESWGGMMDQMDGLYGNDLRKWTDGGVVHQ